MSLLGLSPCRHRLAAPIAVWIGACGALFGAAGAAGQSAPAAKYVWKNVAIGGGGYVLDVVCHPREKNLVYIRTDVGGCYRWDAKNARWIPITDQFRRDQSNYYGGESLALDPNDPNVVYLAAGKYTADWATAGALFKSENRGATWTKLPLDVKMGSNEDHRTSAPRLAVSPSSPAVVLFGSRRDGLWRSENRGKSWRKVTTFPGKSRPGVGITSIVFAPGKPGFVFAASFDDGVYVSGDNGKTWGRTAAGSPATVERLAVASDGAVYATHGKGIAKYTSGGAWADVTPPEASFAFAGLSVNPRNPRDIIAAGQKDSLYLFRSQDGGATWTRKNSVTQSSAPWYPGHMKQIQYVSGLTFDPLVSGRVWLTDWYATYSTNDINADPVVLSNQERGHEEVVVFSLAAPPSGALSLVSGVADVDGFPHVSLDTFPNRGIGDFYGGSGPTFGDTYQVTWSVSDPARLARVGGRRWDNTGGGAVSRDGGLTWTGFASWDAKVTPARIALSATDPDNLVVFRIGPGPALVTRDNGASWADVAGLPDNIVHSPWNWQGTLASDGGRGGVFYAFHNGIFYRSVDSGASFSSVGGGFPSGGQNAVVTVPGRSGEVWLSLDKGGLRRSTDSGASFTDLASVKQSYLFAVGKPAPGSDAPTLYLYGVLSDGRDGIFRSLNEGRTWETIQDPRVPVGNEPNSMTASYRTFGTVFIGTNGRGIYYGSPAVAPPTVAGKRKTR